MDQNIFIETKSLEMLASAVYSKFMFKKESEKEQVGNRIPPIGKIIESFASILFLVWISLQIATHYGWKPSIKPDSSSVVEGNIYKGNFSFTPANLLGKKEYYREADTFMDWENKIVNAVRVIFSGQNIKI